MELIFNTQENNLQWAGEQIGAVDKRAYDTALYVAKNDDPYESLLKVRGFLYGLTDQECGKSIALAVVNLDRVINQLRGFKTYVTYERR
jgi:hypothetical protein